LVVWKMGAVLVHIDEIRGVTFELLAHHLERFEVQRGRGAVLDHHELVDPLHLFDGHIILKATSVLVFRGLCVDVHGPEAGLSGVLPDERVCSHRVDQVVSGTPKPENGVEYWLQLPPDDAKPKSATLSLRPGRFGAYGLP